MSAGPNPQGQRRPLHLRHMYYDGGGNEKYQPLIALCTQGLSQSAFNLWYMGGLVKPAGFRGHVDMHGSYYLDARTFKRLAILKTHLDAVRANPSPNIQAQYLSDIADSLKLSESLPLQTRQILASLATSMHLFSPAEGQAWLKGFNALTATLQARISKIYELSHTTGFLRTPTYVPAFFNNVQDYLGQQGVKSSAAISQMVSLCLPVYAQVIEEHQRQLDLGMSADIPLNFNNLASAAFIQQLWHMEKYGRTIAHINAKGEVSLNILGP